MSLPGREETKKPPIEAASSYIGTFGSGGFVVQSAFSFWRFGYGLW